MTRPYSEDLRDRVVVRFVEAGQLAARGGCGVRGERCECGEVVAAAAGDGERGGQADGRQAALCAGGRARLAAVAHRRDAGRDLARALGGAFRARASW